MLQRGFYQRDVMTPESPHEILLKRRMTIKEYGQYAGPLTHGAVKNPRSARLCEPGLRLSRRIKLRKDNAFPASLTTSPQVYASRYLKFMSLAPPRLCIKRRRQVVVCSLEVLLC